MRIEFCCEEMKREFAIYGAAMLDEHVNMLSAATKWVPITECPHCYAKIKITVKEENG